MLNVKINQLYARDSLASAQLGFIPDIMNLLATYELFEHVHSWLFSGSFPTKFTWKRIVRAAVQNCGQLQREMRIAGHSDFTRFREVFADRDPRTFWQLPSNCYEISLCKLICKLIASPARENQQLCPLCDGIYFDVFAHAACSCVATNDVRNQWLDDITNLFDLSLSAELCALTEDDIFLVLLGRKTTTVLPILQYRDFLFRNFELIRDAAAVYNRYLNITYPWDQIFSSEGQLY